MPRSFAFFFRYLSVGLVGAQSVWSAPAGSDFQALAEQNRRLQEQVRAQQQTIELLNAKVNAVLQASERHDRELRGLQERVEVTPGSVGPSAHREGEIRIGAEVGLAYFHTGAEGRFPKAEFRADDPVITVEAAVWKNVYAFTELKLLPREDNVEDFQLGELYVDFENVSAAWGRPGWLNLRIGRINIPFGEEYQRRGPIANPLISHSLPDLWGVDEGVEAYGKIGPLSYVLAVQNGGYSRLRDFNADKAIVARLGWQPTGWLSVSGSAMRTGQIDTVDDELTELWFGNGFFRALGPASSTATFSANLIQADATARWKQGHLSGSFGHVHFDDSDTTADNSRRLNYGAIEGVQVLVERLYGAVRYSEIRVAGGYPLAGWGSAGTFFFRPSLTEELRRLSVGLGYRIGPPLVLKIEYTRERGRMVNGARRDQEDFFGSEVGFRF